MKLHPETTVQLGGYYYYIHRALGSGAIADAYLAELRTELIPATQVVIKLLRDDVRNDTLHAQGFNSEITVLRELNSAEVPDWPQGSQAVPARIQRAADTATSRRIIALFDYGNATDHAFVVQELAPPAFAPLPVPQSAGSREALLLERSTLAVALALAETIRLVHGRGMALKDFAPATKGDRIRVELIKAAPRFAIKLIDWNITGGRDDQARDLLFFGGHLYAFLLGQQLPSEAYSQPTSSLALGTSGWKRLSEGSRQLLQRLLHPNLRQRYASADELCVDLKQLVDMQFLLDRDNPVTALRDYSMQLDMQRHPTAALVAADLALHSDLPLADADHRFFERQLSDARELNSRSQSQPLAEARLNLAMRSFRSATETLQLLAQDQTLPPDVMADARIYLRVSRIGEWLLGTGRAFSTPDPLPLLDQGAEALTRQEWLVAQTLLKQAEDLQPGLHEATPFTELDGLAVAGQEVDQANAQLEQVQTVSHANDIASLDGEQAQLALTSQAVQLLEQAHKHAPWEPGIEQRFHDEEERLRARQAMLEEYRNLGQGELALANEMTHADQQLVRDQWNDADARYGRITQDTERWLKLAHELVEREPAQQRAQQAVERLQVNQQAITERRKAIALWRQADEAIRQRDFPAADEAITRARALGYPDTPALQTATVSLQRWRQKVMQLQQSVNTALPELYGGRYEQSLESINQSYVRASLTPKELPAQLQQQLAVAREHGGAIKQAFLAWQAGNYQAAIEQLSQVQRVLAAQPNGFRLSGEAAHLLAAAQRLQQIEGELSQASSFDQLKRLYDETNALAPQQIQTLQGKMAQRWLALVSALPEIDQARDQLLRARSLFQQNAPPQLLTLLQAAVGFLEIKHRIDEGEHDPAYGQPRDAATLSADLSALHRYAAIAELPVLRNAAHNALNLLRTQVANQLQELAEKVWQVPVDMRHIAGAQLVARWHALPEADRVLLSDQPDLKQIVELVGELDAYQQAIVQTRDVLAGGGENLQSDLLTVQQITSQLTQFKHAKPAGLDALMILLRQASELEQAALMPVNQQSYARVARINSTLGHALPTVEATLGYDVDTFEPFKQRLASLRGDVRETAYRAAEAASYELERMSQRLHRGDAQLQLAETAALAWGVSTWNKALQGAEDSETVATRSHLTNALNAFQEVQRQAVNTAAEYLKQSRSEAEVRESAQRVEKVLGLLREITAAKPKTNKFDAIEPTTLHELTPLSEQPLVVWRDLMSTLPKRLEALPVAAQHADAPNLSNGMFSSALYTLRDDAELLHDDLVRLVEAVRAVCAQPQWKWEEQGLLGQLDRQALEDVKRADDLLDVTRHAQDQEPAGVLELLHMAWPEPSSDKASTGSIGTREVLLNQQRAAIEGVLRQTLGKRIDQQLAAPNLVNALTGLRNAIRTAPVARITHFLLLERLDARIKAADPAIRLHDERRMLDSVCWAFKPITLAPGRSKPPTTATGGSSATIAPQVAEEWRMLYQEAARREKQLPRVQFGPVSLGRVGLWRTATLLALIFVLLLILAIWGIMRQSQTADAATTALAVQLTTATSQRALLLSVQRENERLATTVAASSQSTIESVSPTPAPTVVRYMMSTGTAPYKAPVGEDTTGKTFNVATSVVLCYKFSNRYAVAQRSCGADGEQLGWINENDLSPVPPREFPPVPVIPYVP